LGLSNEWAACFVVLALVVAVVVSVMTLIPFLSVDLQAPPSTPDSGERGVFQYGPYFNLDAIVPFVS
jgi:hypothetical protein